ncbi:hypothetical protein EHO58_19030 [Leptospira selangorensis]|uniref:RHS repeat-associated core domain-containing protein n=1 Tax=Leptospira selangorensis TaxID=2484982 RepID=UPI0010841094|nr:RHS repeat-associated core domain-containing protein [Leptospira selangorensis]TGK00543.1 hypothetical protein EHO58_19030 [Leptospira selangorensis]
MSKQNRKKIFFIVLLVTAIFHLNLFSTSSIKALYVLFNEETSIPQNLLIPAIDSFGNSNLSYTIQVPQGPKNISPEISLNYNSGRLDEEMTGIGWQLNGIPYLSLDISNGINYDSLDTFVSSLSGRLKKNGVSENFQPEINDFTLYTRVSSGNTIRWIAKDRNGLTYYFGEHTPGSGASLVNQDGNPYFWGLERIEDRYGNGYAITYDPISQQAGYLYPKVIKYSSNTSEIQFLYQDREVETLTTYLYSITKKHKKRLTGIRTYVPTEGGNALAENYSFEYSNISSNDRAVLTTFKRENYLDLFISYSDLSQSNLKNPISPDAQSVNYNLSYRADSSLFTEACNATALTCLCSASSACMAVSGGTAGWFCASLSYDNKGSCLKGYEYSNTFFVDINGDNRPDFVRITGDKESGQNFVSSYFNAEGTSNAVFGAESVTSGLNLSDNSVILPGDLDGDKKVDFLVLEKDSTPIKIFKSKAVRSELTPSSFQVSVSSVNANIPNHSKELKHFLVDMNKDGKADLIQKGTDSSAYKIYPFGTTDFKSPITYTPNEIGLELQTFIDMDGDGVPDFVRLVVNNSGESSITKIKVSLLKWISGNIVERSVYETILSYPGTTGERYFADVNRDGKVDLIIHFQSGDQSRLVQYINKGNSFEQQSIQDINNIFFSEDLGLKGSSAGYQAISIDINNDTVLDRVTYLGDCFQVEIYDPISSSYSNPVTVGADNTSIIELNFNSTPDSIILMTDSSNHFWFHSILDSGDIIDSNWIDASAMLPNTSGVVDSSADSIKKYKSWALKKQFSDVNGDGIIDLIRFYGDFENSKISNGKVYVSIGKVDGQGRVYFSANGDYSFAATSFSEVMDLNNDGRLDYLGINSKYQDSTAYVTLDVPTKIYSSVPYQSTGTLSLLYVGSPGAYKPGLITTIANGSGKTVNAEYKVSSKSSGAISYTDLSGQIKSFIYPVWLLTNVQINHTANVVENTSFTYTDNRYYISGNSAPNDQIGLLGFRKVAFTNSLNNTKVEQVFNLTESAYLAGAVTSESSYQINPSDGTERLIRTKQISYGDATSSFFVDAFGGKFVRPTKISEDRYLLNVKIKTVEESLNYDSYGNILKSAKRTFNNEDSVLEETSFEYPAFDANNWTFGLQTKMTTYSNGVKTGGTEFIFNNGIPAEVHKDLGLSGSQVTKFLSYDAFGNCNLIEEASGNQIVLEYDNYWHTYPTSITNSLGHSKKILYDYKLGKAISEIDQNGNETKYTVDRYGRLIETTRPTDDWSERTIYTDTGLASGATVEVYGHDAENGDVHAINYIDYANRTYKTKKLMYGNIYSVEETEFLSDGKVKAKVGPYIEGINIIKRTEFSYDVEGNNTGILQVGIGAVDITYDNLTTTFVAKNNSGSILTTRVEKADILGRTVEKSFNGKSHKYTYAPSGTMATIVDPDGAKTENTYSISGNLIQRKDDNRGTETIEYYSTDKIKKITYANGSKIEFEYDLLGRTSKQVATNKGGQTSQAKLYYDEESINDSKGLLTSVFENNVETHYEYDKKGFVKKMWKRFMDEDLVLVTHYEYTSGGRLSALIYPDGTKISYQYAPSGAIVNVLYSSPDGESQNQSIVKYEGPFWDTDGFVLRKTFGNGIITNLLIDSESVKPKRLTTGIGSSVYESLEFSIDDLGNVISINDIKNPLRSSTYSYDDQNRLLQATGSFGTEQYSYSEGGKILTKGGRQYSYTDPLHKNAVTAVSSTNSTLFYEYDESGNVKKRNGDLYSYDGYNHVSNVATTNGESVSFQYDYRGSRITKVNETTGTKEISLNNLYQISYSPGKQPLHTLFIYGARDEIIAQIGRNDASLVSISDFKTESGLTNLFKSLRNYMPESFKLLASVTELSYQQFHYKFEQLSLPVRLNKLLILFLLLTILHTIIEKNISNEEFKKSRIRFSIPIVLLSFVSLSFGNCGIVPDGSSSGTPPWVAFPASPGTNVPSVPDDGNTPISNIPGMLFFHLDHLSSTKMISDGIGNLVTGGESGGASHIEYKPYGEINRADSSGPDIFKQKFTGQIEERELNVYDYKSRFYDPDLGRFLQADSIAMTKSVNGFDPYMYVEGNPITKNDPSGHISLDINFNFSLNDVFNWINSAFSWEAISQAINQIVNYLVSEIISTILSPPFEQQSNPLGNFMKDNAPKAWDWLQFSSPLAKSDVGRAITRNREYIYIGMAVIFVALAIYFTLGAVIAAYVAEATAAAVEFFGNSLLLIAEGSFWGFLYAPLYGGIVGAAIGYLQGGLHHMTLKSANWDDAEAKRRATSYGIAGAEIGLLGYGFWYVSYSLYIGFESGQWGIQKAIYDAAGSYLGSKIVGAMVATVFEMFIFSKIIDWVVDKVEDDLKNRVHN